MASGPAAAPTRAVVSATVSVVCRVLTDATAPTPGTISYSNGVTTADIDALGRSQRQRNRMLLVVGGMLLGALLLVPVLGLLISLGVLMLTIAIVVERRPIISSVIVSVVAVGIVHLIFGVLLNVPLPTGLIGLI